MRADCGRPALPDPQMLAGEEIAALLAACAGPAFEDLRDAAIIRLLCETGLRRSELAAPQVDDVDLELNAVYVAAAGRPPRAVPFDWATARALDRYLAARAGHPWAQLPHVWLGRRRRLTERGVAQALCHRGELAGLPFTSRPRVTADVASARQGSRGGLLVAADPRSVLVAGSGQF